MTMYEEAVSGKTNFGSYLQCQASTPQKFQDFIKKKSKPLRIYSFLLLLFCGF